MSCSRGLPRIARLRWIAAAVLVLACARTAAAHDVGISGSVVRVDDTAIAWTLRINETDVVAMGLKSGAPLEGRELLAVSCNGEQLAPTAPPVATVANGHRVLTGRLDRPAACEFAVEARLLEALPRGHKHHVQVFAGERVLTSRILSGTDGSVSIALEDRSPAGGANDTAAFFAMGVEHILEGYDHLLFLLALLLTTGGLAAVARIVTTFTLAHSMSLMLAASGAVHVPTAAVEPLIAASIVYVAAAALIQRTERPEPLRLIFAFGLVHGLGFAGALAEVGGGGAALLSLLAFNGGVEVGQMMVAAPTVLALSGLRAHPLMRRRIVPPCLATTAAVGVVWFVERIANVAR